MPQFVAFIQERKSGPFLSRTFVGRSASEITARLLDSGTAVATVFEPDSVGTLARKPVPLAQVLFFMEQMESALFLNMEPRLGLRIAGLTVTDRSRSGRVLRAVIDEMEKAVGRGESLTSVAKQYPNLFNDVAVGLVAAGEGSGSLDQSFRSIRQLVARTDNVKHQTRMMFLQPAITLLVAFATVAVLVAYVIPQFSSMLDYLGGALPWQTRLMIWASQLVRSNPMMLLLAFALTVVVVSRIPYWVKQIPWTHKVIVRVPVFGTYLLSTIRASFIGVFAQLKRNKISNLEAVFLLKDISWFYPYRTAIARAYIGLQSGQSLARVLSNEADIIGDRNVQYFRFMEETGSDVAQLERLAILMNRDLDAYTERLKEIVTPIILVILAGIVGLIAAAIILPMYEIYNRI